MKLKHLYATLAVTLLAGIQTSQATLLEYSAGHADVRPLYQNGQLSLSYRFDNTAVVDGSLLGLPVGGEVFMEPSDVYVRVADSTGSSAPAAFPTFFTFLGSPIPDPVYVLPQNNVAGQPFFGFSTEELVASDWSDITYALTAFSGPANFALYQTSGFSNSVKWQSENGVDASDAFTPPLGHDHYNWAFTEAGLYELTITASGTHLTDGFKSATDTYYFAVGDMTSAPNPVPEPSTLLLAGVSVVGLLVGVRGRL